MKAILTLRPLALCLVLALAACGGGGGGGTAATTTATTPTMAGKLTISESYNTTSGDLDFSAATGANSAETGTGGDLTGVAYCAIRLSKVKVGTSKDDFDVNLYFKQSDKSIVFVGIIDITSIIAFNMTTNTDAEKAKIKIDTATKTATFTDVLLKSNENAANKAKINGTLTFIGSSTAACGT